MRIGIIAQGEMGTGIGWRLAQSGAEVSTCVVGRSAASRERAERAGIKIVGDDEALIANCDMLLSILPPSEALSLAQRLAPALSAQKGRVLYVDCNAVAPETVRRVAAAIAPTGSAFADVGIVGGPPRPGYVPRLYVSGEAAQKFLALRDFGLEILVVEGGIGAASALKLSYAALTKGLTAIGIAVARGATSDGVAEMLRAEFLASQPELHKWLTRQMPTMIPKAYRWVGEMEEIARFLGDDPTAAMFEGAARSYEKIAAAKQKGDHAALEFLTEVFKR